MTSMEVGCLARAIAPAISEAQVFLQVVVGSGSMSL